MDKGCQVLMASQAVAALPGILEIMGIWETQVLLVLVVWMDHLEQGDSLEGG